MPFNEVGAISIRTASLKRGTQTGMTSQVSTRRRVKYGANGTESNLRPTAYKAVALPLSYVGELVDPSGVEPATVPCKGSVLPEVQAHIWRSRAVFRPGRWSATPIGGCVYVPPYPLIECPPVSCSPGPLSLSGHTAARSGVTAVASTASGQ